MKKLQRLVVLGCCMALSVVLLSGCSKKEAEIIRVGAVKDMSAVGLLKMMEEDKASVSPKYEFGLRNSADELEAAYDVDMYDMAIVSPEAAARLNVSKKGEVRILAVNSLGGYYIYSDDSKVVDLNSLKGQTIYATGQGTSAEYVLRHVLAGNGLNYGTDVIVEWYKTSEEVQARMEANRSVNAKSVVMLEQPDAQEITNQINRFNLVADLTSEWITLNPNRLPVASVLIADKDFIKDNEEQISEFLDTYEASLNYTVGNPDYVASFTESYGITTADVAVDAISFGKLTYLEGKYMKSVLEGFYETLYQQNEELLGGVLPEEEFYYIEK